MSTVYLSVGSNSGDRRALIGRAVAAISMRLPVAAVRTSSYYQSKPWGFDSPHPFLNIAIALRFHRSTPWTDSDAEALLDILQGIEHDISPMPHRNADGSYRDRAIDIDIIAIDSLTIVTPRLTLPHPLAHLRDFVMTPLHELTATISLLPMK